MLNVVPEAFRNVAQSLWDFYVEGKSDQECVDWVRFAGGWGSFLRQWGIPKKTDWTWYWRKDFLTLNTALRMPLIDACAPGNLFMPTFRRNDCLL